MSPEPTPRPSSPWAPSSARRAPTAEATYPPHAATRPVAASGPPTYAPPTYAPRGAYPRADGPPVAGGGQPPAWPPTGSSPFTPPPAHPAPNRKQRRERRGSRGRGLVAVAALSALLAGAAGGAAGVLAAQQDDAPPNTTAAQTTPVATEVPPVSGDSSEPAAAVATALGPAVVQIETGQGLGSGFIYDASGLIMTAHHVVDGAETVDIRMADGTRVTGTVVGEDPSTDVAVVKIEPTEDMAVATLATGVTTKVGQTAIAIGSPFGLDQSVTAGIVSAVGRSAETPGGVIPAIQTDAPINSGNSGGALADRTGRVIGINDSIATGGGGSTGNLGIGFAIPIDIAKAVADRIVAGQPTESGFLGVEGADATGSRTGAAITSVSAGSPADKAGLTTSDVVIAVDGKPVSSMIDLAAKVRTRQPGDTIELTVSTNGAQRVVEVTLETAPSN
ncbi:trypsin-like peptidase domain-containing protein [Aquihabitans daechungensis]|uniref:trypsin-like peptidase domain-containing protein n=1 Tax=Aquihabitans daechungensis TaxID=1052257 RepID=UPI003BA04C06